MKLDFEFENEERDIIKAISKIFAFVCTIAVIIFGILLFIRGIYFTSYWDYCTSMLMMAGILNQWIWSNEA